MAFNTMTLSIESHYAGCCYADCSDFLNVMLSVIKLDVFMLNVILMSVAASKKGLIVLADTDILFNSNQTIFLGLRPNRKKVNLGKKLKNLFVCNLLIIVIS
jgi:hypothetical protein